MHCFFVFFLYIFLVYKTQAHEISESSVVSVSNRPPGVDMAEERSLVTNGDQSKVTDDSVPRSVQTDVKSFDSALHVIAVLLEHSHMTSSIACCQTPVWNMKPWARSCQFDGLGLNVLSYCVISLIWSVRHLTMGLKIYIIIMKYVFWTPKMNIYSVFN